MTHGIRSWGQSLGVVLLTLAVTVGTGCSRRETGLMLEVTVAEGHEAGLDMQVDELVFHIAVQRADGRYVLDPAVNEYSDVVTGRSLVDDPYLLLIKDNGDGDMESVRAAVLGYRGDAVVAWGWLENPDSQEMIQGNIVFRTVALYDASQIPPEFYITALGCLILERNGEIVAHAPNDMDCDDSPSDEDCNDEDPAVGPGMREICGNGIDDDCNGVIDEIVDEDGDGFTNCDPVDCDDGDADVYPGAPELCDGKDNDCDGTCDVEFDLDGDGYTDCLDGTGSAAGVNGFCGTVPTSADNDCDDSRADMNPGLAEVCNDIDDNCNGLVDEGLSVACYEGPAGTENVGQCRAGMSHCIRGVQTGCTGQIQPIPEACNGLDDDCNGLVDEAMPDMTCGLGACRVSVPYCVGNQPQQCQPGTGSVEICNGVDDDCNGLVDETCACIHVRPAGDGGDDTHTGGALDPMATINAAIARAAQAGQPKIVCVASTSGCVGGNWTYFDEDVVMMNGVSVYGGYDPANAGGWTRRAACRTEIRGQTGPAVYFGHGVQSRTILDGFVASVVTPAGTVQSAVVAIEGSPGAVVSNCSIFGGLQGDQTFGILVTDDANGTPSMPEILNSSVEGGDGDSLSVGVYSINSSPFIQGSCDAVSIDVQARCTAGCWNGKHIRGHRTNGDAAYSFGVWLENSPGARVDQSAVCSVGEDVAAGIHITGNAAGTQITRSNMTAGGAFFSNDGIFLEDCGGASPWIANNDSIWSDGDGNGNSVAVGVRSLGNCHPLIEGNRLITGGGEGSSNDCRGVLCGTGPNSGQSSRCAIVGNETINGSNWGLPPSSYGVLCEDGACSMISQNLLINGRGGADCVGVYLRGASGAVVDRNIIQGGCGPTWITGVIADDSTARIQNNVIGTALCTDSVAAGSDFVGLWVANGGGANEPDVHSNAIFGGGGPSMSCLSSGIVMDLSVFTGLPTGPLGIFRNNLIHPGVCNQSHGVWERSVNADPRIFENNALVGNTNPGALYLDENGTILSTQAQINGLLDMTVSGNLDQGCGFSWVPGSPVTLPSGSPCRNAGTPTGAPGWDYFGAVRPQESAPEIGPDEYTP